MPKIKHMCGPGRERWGQEAEKEMEARILNESECYAVKFSIGPCLAIHFPIFNVANFKPFLALLRYA